MTDAGIFPSSNDCEDNSFKYIAHFGDLRIQCPKVVLNKGDRLYPVKPLAKLTYYLYLVPDCCWDAPFLPLKGTRFHNCLLYTSDAADDLLCVDLGGRRLIKKKK